MQTLLRLAVCNEPHSVVRKFAHKKQIIDRTRASRNITHFLTFRAKKLLLQIQLSTMQVCLSVRLRQKTKTWNPSDTMEGENGALLTSRQTAS